jgi:hypothetical protein
MSAIKALMTGLIDYAGLFPPAKLDMRKAVSNYREYRNGDEAWALGRLIVPVSRLSEFAEVFNEVCCGEWEFAWLLSALVSDDASEDAKRIADFAQGAVLIDTLEVKAETLADVTAVLDVLPPELTPYVEVDPERAGEILPVLASRRARAKIRTGGLTPDAFPESDAVAHFLMQCAAAKVPFKATAGLHHPMRGMRKLTYETTSPWGHMHGFVNMFMAAAYAYFGKDEPFVQAMLDEESPTAISVAEDCLSWRGQRLTTGEIEEVRGKFAICFGSCSFTEPITELKALGWL